MLAQQTGRPPVGLLVSQMTSYGGKNSMFDTVCTKDRVTNGIAMVGLSNGEKLTKELVVKADPDFFMVSAPKKDDRYGSQKFKDEFLQDPAYQGMKGLKNIAICILIHKIVYMPSKASPIMPTAVFLI